jgi:hypothetical protein
MKKTAKQPMGTRVPLVKKKAGKVASAAKADAKLLKVVIALRRQVSTQQIEIDVLCEWLGKVSERVGKLDVRK